MGPADFACFMKCRGDASASDIQRSDITLLHAHSGAETLICAWIYFTALRFDDGDFILLQQKRRGLYSRQYQSSSWRVNRYGHWWLGWRPRLFPAASGASHEGSDNVVGDAGNLHRADIRHGSCRPSRRPAPGGLPRRLCLERVSHLFIS